MEIFAEFRSEKLLRYVPPTTTFPFNELRERFHDQLKVHQQNLECIGNATSA